MLSKVKFSCEYRKGSIKDENGICRERLTFRFELSEKDSRRSQAANRCAYLGEDNRVRENTDSAKAPSRQDTWTIQGKLWVEGHRAKRCCLSCNSGPDDIGS